MAGKLVEMMSPLDVLEEFVSDVRVVAGCRKIWSDEPSDNLDHDILNWPDLAITYEHALAVIEREKRMCHDSTNPLKIVEWLRTGELEYGELPRNTSELLDDLGDKLDCSGSGDLFGSIVFKAENGVWYVATVEGLIAEANPAYLKDLRDDDAESPD